MNFLLTIELMNGIALWEGIESNKLRKFKKNFLKATKLKLNIYNFNE